MPAPDKFTDLTKREFIILEVLHAILASGQCLSCSCKYCFGRGGKECCDCVEKAIVIGDDLVTHFSA